METDPTKLTSFHPLSPVSSPSGFSIAKLFNLGRRRDTVNSVISETPVGNEASPSTVRREVHHRDGCSSKDHIYSWMSNYDSKEDEASSDENNQSSRKDKWRYRNVRTILRRLSAFTIDRRWHQTTGDFKHNFKQYWMPDEHCKECYECNDKFNTFRRRHHCRVCGQIFCYRCCGQEVAGKVIGFTGDIRVCNYCHKIVNAYLSDDMEKSIEALSEDIRVCDPNYNAAPDGHGGSTGSLNSMKSNFNIEDPIIRIKKATSTNSLVNNTSTTAERALTPVRSPFDAFGVTPTEANRIKEDYLRDLWKQMNEPGSGLELLDHRYKSKTYHNCLIASDLCDWMIKSNKASNSNQAVNSGQALLESGWIEHVISVNKIAFKNEYILFQPTKMALQETESAQLRSIMFSNSDDSHESQSKVENTVENDDDEEAPKWFKQMSNVSTLNVECGQSGTSKLCTYNRGYATGHHLDLDHLPTSVGESNVATEEDLSLQMNLKSSQQEDDINSLPDQSNKISFITPVPPLPLDSYVCVEGHQTSARKKIAKAPSNSNLPEDILKGVVFPRPNTEHASAEVDGISECGKDESGERLARDRLNAAAHHHIHALLQQLLKQNNLSPTWENIITPFLSKISEKVIPDVGRGDDMDIRQYVWITKVPGAQKSDSHLVSGVVFRKNVSHKRMTSVFSQPKILMMSCAIEYQRVELKMSSLDPLVLQEYAFLKNFVKRVLDIKPNLLLVEKNVARVAQDMLLAGGVTLIHNIKPKIMENIQRCTGAEILQKMEQVTRPKLGTCQQFRAQKYVLPSGELKTLIYLDGCAVDLGCSLILRGANAQTLAEIKKLVKYFIYVSYHLRLEAKFLMDEFAMPPPLDKLIPQCDLFEARSPAGVHTYHSSEVDGDTTDRPKQKQMTELHSESDRFRFALKKVLLSSSPFCNYSVPYLLTDDGKLCPTRQFIVDQIYSSNYLTNTFSVDECKFEEEEEEGTSVLNTAMENSNIIMKPLHPFTDPSVLIDCIENKDDMNKILNNFRAQGGRIDLKMHQEYEQQEFRKVYGDSFIERMSSVSKIVSLVEEEVEDRKDSVAKKSVDNVPKGDCFDAYNHQKIPVLFSSYSTESDNFPKPCISPWAVFMVFYGRNDITLGGFLERYCFRPSYICPDHNCEVPMVKHIRYFAHGNGSLCINMRNLESPIPGYDRTILTWSWCKICQQVTPVVPLSFECWSLSFAKYLELRFYGSEYTRRASAEPCGHSLHHDHYQYFSFANMAASFKYRPISLHEIVLPAYTVTIGNQRKPQHLMDEVSEIYEKIGTVTITIMDRIGELRSEDSGVGNASRESKIKEFLSELQKEQSNLHDCIHVVKSKIELLIAKKEDSPTPNETHSFINIDSIQAEQSTSLLNTSGESTDPCVEKDGDTGGVNVSGTGGGGSGCTSGGNGSEMSCEEVHMLMVDIGKKLFHLKKSICEIVESWNLKLQEFITQDRKKEKGLVRSTSPTKVTPASNDITEYYLYGDENPPPDSDAINQPKTIMHMHPEPISEVFLTDGTILRQTYLGTTPRSGSPFEQTQKNNQVSSSITRKLSANMQIDNKEKAGSCDPTSPLAGKTNTDASSKLGSPYQVIKCPLVDDVDPAESASKLINEEKGSEKNMKPPMLSVCVVDSIDKGETSSHEDVEPITIETIRQNDTDGFYSDSELSLKVEYNSDRGEFSDNHSIDSDEDIESNFPESEVYSDCEMAEEDSGVDTILIGQSAVDFASRKYSRDPLCSKRRLRGVSYLSGFTEFPKIKEESIGKIQYLTTKEVKVMQVQRRLRTEWESRIRIALDADAVRSDSPPYSLENSPTKGKSCSLESAHLDTPLSKPQLIRVSSSPSADIVTKKAPRNRQSNPLIKRLLQSSCEASELCDKSHIANTTSKKRGNSQGDTLESTLKIRSLSDSSIPDIEGMSELFKKTNSTNTNQDDGTFSPTQPDSGIERSAKTMESPSPFLSPIAHVGRIDDTSSEPSQQSSEFTQQKGIGHRRMKSAPPKPVNNVCDVEIPSELNSEAPFIFLQSKHVQLSKMAEQLCQDERRDDERDIPEVLQFEGLNKNITSKTAQMQEDAIDSVSTTGKPKSEIGDVTETRSTTGDVLNKRGGGDKMKKMITNLLTSATFQPIPRPFPSWEQYMPQVGGTAPIVINEKEPTSLIAFTLSSQDFLDQLHTIQDLMAGKKVKRPLESTPTTSQPASPDIRRKGDMLSVGYTRTLNPSPLSHGKCEVMLQNTNNWNGTVENVNINDALEPYQSSTSAVSYIPEQPVLKSVGRNHPLSSVEFDSATDTPLDTDDIPSCEEPIDDGSCSIKSGVLDDSGKKKEEVASPDFHIKLQFQNNNAKFYCSVYYAEQFRQLRELIFPEGEERFIQSLARCKFWKATGGKSGSSFSKSLDDRFVMKQMSRLEVQSFVDFGPRYFAYINKAVKEKRPTAIAKLLGVYRIGFKNSVTNTTMRQDVLVMENLFYNKKVSKIYDLKGSVRSRYVQSSTKEDVLMDENLLETICDSPLFIRPHGKAVLSKAIFNDTEFLSTNMVMDYSLLVGIDEVNSKLVVGIIDYIRTYTWDKKLESYVKSTGILGGQGKMPTVVSPDVYRLRFTAAMTQHYFLMVPDKWTGFGEDIS